MSTVKGTMKDNSSFGLFQLSRGELYRKVNGGSAQLVPVMHVLYSSPHNFNSIQDQSNLSVQTSRFFLL